MSQLSKPAASGSSLDLTDNPLIFGPGACLPADVGDPSAGAAYFAITRVGTNNMAIEMKQNATNRAELTVNGSNNVSLNAVSGDLALNCAGGQGLIFKNNGTEFVRLVTDGSFGVGTTAPDRKLDVTGAIKMRDHNTGMVWATPGNVEKWYVFLEGDDESLRWYTNSAPNAFRLFTDGSVSMGTSTHEPSAMLNLSTTTQGFLPPRMSQTDRDDISSPAEGLVIYNETSHALNFYNGTAWAAV